MTQEDQPSRLEMLGRLLRGRSVERRRLEEAARAELVPADGGVVHGPTRAEVILTLLRAFAWFPAYFPLMMFALWFVVELTIGWRAFESARWVVPRGIAIPGTAIIGFVVLSLIWTIAPRRLLTVRVRVFEKGNLEPYLLIVAILVYALVFGLAFVF